MLRMTPWTLMAPWKPLAAWTGTPRDLNRMFGQSWSAVPGREHRLTDGVFGPASELFFDENAWHVRLVVPGVEPKDLNIEVSGNLLTVSGELGHETKGEHENIAGVTRGRFERRFTIPERVDVDKAEASYRHGILELTFPLEEAAKPRRIAITAADEGRQLDA